MKNTITNSYPLSYLVEHPATKVIIRKHLSANTYSDEQLLSVEGSLDEMFKHNMGGGIPYEIIIVLMKDLDEIEYPLKELT